MNRPGGYATWVGDGPVKERDTFTCTHCNSVVIVEPFQAAADAGGWCVQCAKPLCRRCAARPECVPFLKRVEQEEARDRFKRQVRGDYR